MSIGGEVWNLLRVLWEIELFSFGLFRRVVEDVRGFGKVGVSFVLCFGFSSLIVSVIVFKRSRRVWVEV